MLERGDVEPREMENLENLRVRQQRLEARRVIGRAVELNQMGVSVAGGKLHDAQGIAVGDKPHGFAVDGDDGAEIQARRKVAFVKRIGHALVFRIAIVNTGLSRLAHDHRAG